MAEFLASKENEMSKERSEKLERRGWKEGVEAAAGVYKRALTVPASPQLGEEQGPQISYSLEQINLMLESARCQGGRQALEELKARYQEKSYRVPEFLTDALLLTQPSELAVPELCPSQPDVWQQKVWDKLNTIETLLREQGKSG